MKRNLKAITMVVVFCISVFCFAGCKVDNTAAEEKGTYNIVCTFFAQYDWIKNITDGSEDINVSLICDNGMDLHSYQMTAEDMLAISTCDLLVTIGGESDIWAQKAANASGAKLVSLTELAGISDNEHHHKEEHDEHLHNDEHVWLSVNKAKDIVYNLAEIICKDVENDSIKKHAEEYIKKLEELNAKYEDVCSGKNNVMVVADRFPFAHMAEDYNIECFAAFPGCSADTDASFETVIELADAVDKYGLKYVIVTETSDKKTAEAVIKSTKDKDSEILVLDSMQSLTSGDIENKTGYLDFMERNLEVLSIAFES